MPSSFRRAQPLAGEGGSPGAVSEGDWKLLQFLEDGRLELYNLREDLGEQHDRAESKPELANALSLKLAGWRQGIGAPIPARRIPERPKAR